jgi:RNase H-fold protein (predicted Holliday junction resolvase)
MGRWIGIDFGVARTGISHTDAAGLMAFPFKTVATPELMTVLEQLVNDAPFSGFALGLPNAWGMHTAKGTTHSTVPHFRISTGTEEEMARSSCPLG